MTRPPEASTPIAATPIDAHVLAHVGHVAERLGDRWSLVVIAALLAGPMRYGELQRGIDGIAPNILSARLRKLHESGLVVSSPYSDRPRRFEYRLTADGEDLADALRLLADWSARTSEAERAQAPSHAICGSPLELRWWCSTCAEEAAPADDEPILA
jgi:DNA-binding HxlR family transcriptional regulator